MLSRFRRDLGPLDLDIVERAFDGVSDATTDDTTSAELESDEELETALRRELMEIAYSNGVSDHEARRYLNLADLSDSTALTLVPGLRPLKD